MRLRARFGMAAVVVIALLSVRCAAFNCTGTGCDVPSPDSDSAPASVRSPAPMNFSKVLDERPAPDNAPAPKQNWSASIRLGVQGSCVNRCTGRSGECWCNAACVRYDDCCDDFMDSCNYTTTTTHSGNPAPTTENFTDFLPAPDYDTTTTTKATTTQPVHPDNYTLPAPDFKKDKNFPRTPGPTTTTTLGPWDFSCEGKCAANLPTGTKSGCHCDQECEHYDDCCWDWSDYCNPTGGFVFPARTFGCWFLACKCVHPSTRMHRLPVRWFYQWWNTCEN